MGTYDEDKDDLNLSTDFTSRQFQHPASLEHRVELAEKELTAVKLGITKFFRDLGQTPNRIDKLDKDVVRLGQQIAHKDKVHREEVERLTGRIEGLEAQLNGLIQKLNTSKIRTLLDSDEFGLSRVVGSAGVSREGVRRDYSVLIEKLNRVLQKRRPDWALQRDSRDVASGVVQNLIRQIESLLQRSPALRAIPVETVSATDLSEAVAVVVAPNIVELFAELVRSLAALEYRLDWRAEGLFPTIVASVADTEIDVVHDGTIQTSLALSRA